MGSTLAEVQAALNNPATSVYLYIGAENATGWTIAQTACGMAANVKALRVDSFAVVASLLPPGDYVAVAFGWNGAPKCHLGIDAASDLIVVVGKIAEAQS